jgi:hypothetical protein
MFQRCFNLARSVHIEPCFRLAATRITGYGTRLDRSRDITLVDFEAIPLDSQESLTDSLDQHFYWPNIAQPLAAPRL